MRKNILLFSYLAFFGSGCFSTNPTGTDHKDTGFSYEAKSFDHICEVKESFQNYMNSQKEHIKSEFDRISEIMRTPEKRDVMLARALVAGGTSLLVIGSFAAIVHASPLLLLGSAGIAVCSLINKSEIDTFPQAWGQGLAIGLTSGMIIAGSAGINQLAHLSHDSGHNGASSSLPVGTPAPTIKSHSGSGYPNPTVGTPAPTTPTPTTTPTITSHDNKMVAIEYLGRTNGEMLDAYKRNSLEGMNHDLSNAEKALTHAHKEIVSDKNTFSPEIKKLESQLHTEIEKLEKAVSNAHPEDPSHRGSNYGIVEQGNSGYPYVGQNLNDWEKDQNLKGIHSLEEQQQKINSLENNLKHEEGSRLLEEYNSNYAPLDNSGLAPL